MRLSTRQRAYLDVMGVEVWQSRDALPEVVDETPAQESVNLAPEPVPESPQLKTPQAKQAEPAAQPPVASNDWQALQQQVSGCTACALHEQRRQAVFGVGDEQADVLIIGEAPEQDEDLQGEPFVARAGQLLNAMLAAINLRREAVFITNIVKCRPPQNRDPRPEEAEACSAYLLKQIEHIQPRVILAMSRVAAHQLLQCEGTVGEMRGSVHRHAATDIPVIVTYHPAYLLRKPLDKRKSWEDLKSLRQLLANSVTAD